MYSPYCSTVPGAKSFGLMTQHLQHSASHPPGVLKLAKGQQLQLRELLRSAFHQHFAAAECLRASNRIGLVQRHDVEPIAVTLTESVHDIEV